MLKLILGRAKSGKTAAVMDAIRQRVAAQQGPTLLLIPEQYSHEAETELLRVCGDRLCLYAEVLSFSRLWARVETELGCRQTALDAGGRALCLARAVEAVGSRLKVCGSARRQVAMQQRLLRAIDECKTACISPETLEACLRDRQHTILPGRTDALSEKLEDLALVYGAYEAIAAQSGLDPMDRLNLLAGHLPRSRYARACCYIDGFTDFTAQESRVIEAFLRAGADVTVCLTADGLEESHEIFEPSRRAAGKLLRLAESLGVPAEVTKMSPPEGDAPMAVLERELFGFSEKTYDGQGCISLVCAPDLTSECESAAARCLDLVRETGCRWRDIAVAARNYDTYRAGLESIFPHYGIPLYSARKSDLSEKPLIALIRAAYDTVTGGWDLDDILTYLKTGLAGLDAGECDELENYAFLWSLRGKAWTKPEDWASHPDGFTGEYTDEVWARLNRINALRRRAAAPLLVLAEESAVAGTGLEQARALAKFFAALELPARLKRRADELKAAGRSQTAAEYAQLWALIAGALEQAAAVLGDAPMDAETFGALFSTMLSSYDVGTIPMSLDRVSAGDMDRMRRRHIRHLIVLGCDSSSLPRAPEDTGLFSDEDRETLRAAGLELGSTAGDRLDREFALIYNCFTLPGDTLTLSWCAAGGEGGKAAPAFVVRRAGAVFSLTPTPPDIDRCRAHAPAPAFELAAAAIGAPASAGSLRTAALEYFTETQNRTAELQRLSEAARITRGRLSRGAVRALYGDTPQLSASRLGRLADCRFAYFLQYGLKAKPKQALEFTPPEFGTFQHEILQKVAEAVMDAGGFHTVSRAQIDELTDRFVAEYVREKLNDFREKSQRFVYLFRRLSQTVRTVVGDMAEELSRGDFVPLDFELNFGDREAFPPIRLGEGDESLILSGIADRVDGYVHEGRLYVRVVDYKTGTKSFSLSDVWYGMGLQMLLYLFALQQNGEKRYGKEIVPAGVLYVPARDAMLSTDTALTAEEILAEKAKKLRRSGLLLADEEILQAMERGETPKYLPVKFNKDGEYTEANLATAERFGMLSRHINETLKALAKELHSGSVAADPWFRGVSAKACDLCDYAAICHLDEENDCIRYLTPLKDAQVWSALEAEKEEP